MKLVYFFLGLPNIPPLEPNLVNLADDDDDVG